MVDWRVEEVGMTLLWNQELGSGLTRRLRPPLKNELRFPCFPCRRKKNWYEDLNVLISESNSRWSNRKVLDRLSL